METEFYHLPERCEVMVNITDLYDAELRKVLAEVGEEFSWTGVENYSTVSEGELSQWLYLLGARVRVPV